jgi:hypothetical protein
VSDFARLVRIVWSDLDERQGALERLFSKGKEPRLELTVTPGHISLGVSLGEDDFIPGVATHTAQLSSGGDRTLDSLASDLVDDLVLRALNVGRTNSERRQRPAA